jgi:hypothetical protein
MAAAGVTHFVEFGGRSSAPWSNDRPRRGGDQRDFDGRHRRPGEEI